MSRTRGTVGVVVLIACIAASPAAAQTLTQRGFVEGSTFLFPQQAPNDPARAVGDLLAREEVFYKPAPWIQFAGGIDLRANSHDQVDDRWRLDLDDRGPRRPRASLRRLTATLTRGPVTVDLGKQFIRGGKADLVHPTDRFAPRDFINVVDTEFLAVTGARAVVQHRNETFEGVWVPRFTPSRAPLFDQRWTVLPAEAATIAIVDAGSELPGGSQVGVRWGHVGRGFEYSLSFFNGFNHLPNVVPTTAGSNAETAESAEKICSACSASSAFLLLGRSYPAIRTYGGDIAVPTSWFTIKGEAAYFTSPAADSDPSRQSAAAADAYVLYVVQLERQTGEWVIVAGYAGEAITARRSTFTFALDRGMTRSIVARASYTIDPVRSVAFETAIRQNGASAYGKIEYSQARGPHWRATVTGVGIGGQRDDFLGQYHRNSHATLAVRYSF